MPSVASAPRAISILIPYAIAVVAQFPMLFLYFRDLWARPHYQFFPFAILATAVFAYSRWPRDLDSPFRHSWLSNALLGVAVICGLLAIVFLTPWFSALSCMLLVSSLLMRTVDTESLGTLGSTSTPLYACLMLPLGFDTTLITLLQRISAGITSRLLDLVGLKHFIEGVVINVPGTKGYGIEEACSGVQSFFTLTFFAAVLVVLNRRITSNPYRLLISVILCLAATLAVAALSNLQISIILGGAILLWGLLGIRAAAVIMSAVFWAIFMNTIRITMIPIAQEYFGFDLAHGIVHDLLGYAVLALGIFLLFSTDQLIYFLLGAHDPEGGVISRALNPNSSGKESTRRKPISQTGTRLTWAVAILLAFFGIVQMVQFGTALAQPNISIRFFDADVTVEYSKDDIPKEIGGWKQVDYNSTTRRKGSDLGMKSDVWQFRAPRCAPIVSLDQTFPGWHELTTCYRNNGWILQERHKIVPSEEKPALGSSAESSDSQKSSAEPWPYVEATFKKETGEHAYLLFSLFDAAGKALDPPSTWGTINSFLIRLKNRMNHKLRSNLFQSEAYQTQVLIQSYSELDDELKNEVRDRYFAVREAMRTSFLQKKRYRTRTRRYEHPQSA